MAEAIQFILDYLHFRMFVPDGRVHKGLASGGTDAIVFELLILDKSSKASSLIVNVIDHDSNLFDHTHHTETSYSNIIYVHIGKSSATLSRSH